MKQAKKVTRKQKKEKHSTPANYYKSRRHQAAVRLNNELNEIAESIRESTKDLDLEFSGSIL